MLFFLVFLIITMIHDPNNVMQFILVLHSSFSIILSSNSMNSLNRVHSDVSMKFTGHHKIKFKVLI